MNGILRFLLIAFGHHAKLRLLSQAKRTGTLAYLRVLQATRRILAGSLAAFFVLQFMVLSFAGALVTGVWLLDLDTQLKLQILFGVFCAGFGLPFLALAIGLSERVWYKASGAQKIVEDLRSTDRAA